MLSVLAVSPVFTSIVYAGRTRLVRQAYASLGQRDYGFALLVHVLDSGPYWGISLCLGIFSSMLGSLVLGHNGLWAQFGNWAIFWG